MDCMVVGAPMGPWPLCQLWRLRGPENPQHCLDRSGQCLQVSLTFERCSGPSENTVSAYLWPKDVLLFQEQCSYCCFKSPLLNPYARSHQQANHYVQYTPYLSYQFTRITITSYCRQLYWQVLLHLVNVLLVTTPSFANPTSQEPNPPPDNAPTANSNLPQRLINQVTHWSPIVGAVA